MNADQKIAGSRISPLAYFEQTSTLPVYLMSPPFAGRCHRSWRVLTSPTFCRSAGSLRLGSTRFVNIGGLLYKSTARKLQRAVPKATQKSRDAATSGRVWMNWCDLSWTCFICDESPLPGSNTLTCRRICCKMWLFFIWQSVMITTFYGDTVDD